MTVNEARKLVKEHKLAVAAAMKKKEEAFKKQLKLEKEARPARVAMYVTHIEKEIAKLARQGICKFQCYFGDYNNDVLAVFRSRGFSVNKIKTSYSCQNGYDSMATCWQEGLVISW